MALIKCNECGKDISDKANVCIHCGYPLEKEQKLKNYYYEEENFYFFFSSSCFGNGCVGCSMFKGLECAAS